MTLLNTSVTIDRKLAHNAKVLAAMRGMSRSRLFATLAQREIEHAQRTGEMPKIEEAQHEA